MKRIKSYIVHCPLFLAAALLFACKGPELAPGHIGQDTGCGFAAGDELVFGAMTPALAGTKAGEGSYEHDNYHYVRDNYDFDVTILDQGTALGTATYSFPEGSQDPYGALNFSDAGRKPLLWYYMDVPYAFRAEAGTVQVEADQKSRKNFLRQDKMSGYAGYPGVNHDEPCYMTAREWYNKNKEVIGLTETSAFYQRIPLYLKHHRSKISVILKAGEGVERNNLRYDPQEDIYTARDLVSASVYSYDQASQMLDITPFLDWAPVTYGTETQNSACFDAIVEPFNYMEGTNAKDLKIATVSLSGMKFSFRAANDLRYVEWEKLDDGDPEKAVLAAALEESYNLTPGKHLVLEVTLSTATRKILITAYVTDWDERIYSTVCDDNGTSGKPVIIENQEDLEEFINGADNRSGKVAYIGPAEFEINDQWNPTGKVLKATLNAASANVSVVNRLFDKVEGQFINAHLIFGNSSTQGSVTTPVADVVPAVVALENTGTIERVTVSPLNEEASATRAAVVVTNQGTIMNCSSSLPVNYTETPTAKLFVGGIAAESLNRFDSDGNLKAEARIEGCTVSARVSESVVSSDEQIHGLIYGGGIVGCAEGYVVNNTFEYGITLSQDAANFRNILSEEKPIHPQAEQVLTASGNSWPTAAENPRANGNNYVGSLYNHVIDCSAELKILVNSNSTHNLYGARYRISDSFSVCSDDWKTGSGSMIGHMSDSKEVGTSGNVFFELDGNNKEIHLVKGTDAVPGCAPMLFTNVTGRIHDLTVVCDDPIIYHLPEDITGGLVTSVAPLAYSVSRQRYGTESQLSDGTLSNVRVRAKVGSGAYVEAMAPSGMVVWAYGGALMENCSSDVEVRVKKPDDSGTSQFFFAGGLVNSACDATLNQSKYLRESLSATPEQNVFYGGIVGGAYIPEGHQAKPSILFTDCASRLAWMGTRTSWGAIIGYAVYEDSNVMYNATAEGCQGNWWDGYQDVKPVGRKLEYMSNEKVIGKRNSVEPIWDERDYITE